MCLHVANQMQILKTSVDSCQIYVFQKCSWYLKRYKLGIHPSIFRIPELTNILLSLAFINDRGVINVTVMVMQCRIAGHLTEAENQCKQSGWLFQCQKDGEMYRTLVSNHKCSIRIRYQCQPKRLIVLSFCLVNKLQTTCSPSFVCMVDFHKNAKCRWIKLIKPEKKMNFLDV